MFALQTEMPASYQGRYVPEELSEDELRKITQTLGEEPLFVVYWYGLGSYEGAGHMLVSTDGMRWHDADLGHCSCHGPTEYFTYSSPSTLQDLEARYTKEAYRDVAPLFEAIRTHDMSRL
jgi:hypothetical protein